MFDIYNEPQSRKSINHMYTDINNRAHYIFKQHKQTIHRLVTAATYTGITAGFFFPTTVPYSTLALTAIAVRKAHERGINAYKVRFGIPQNEMYTNDRVAQITAMRLSHRIHNARVWLGNEARYLHV